MTRQASNHPAKNYFLWLSRDETMLAGDFDDQGPDAAHGEVGGGKSQVIMTLPRMLNTPVAQPPTPCDSHTDVLAMSLFNR